MREAAIAASGDEFGCVRGLVAAVHVGLGLWAAFTALLVAWLG